MADETHKLTQEQTVKTGHEYELIDGNLVEVHDWWVDCTSHRFECECGEKFNKRSSAKEHLKAVAKVA